MRAQQPPKSLSPFLPNKTQRSLASLITATKRLGFSASNGKLDPIYTFNGLNLLRMDCMSRYADFPYIVAGLGRAASNMAAETALSTPVSDVIDNVKRLRIPHLKIILRREGLRTSGAKAALQGRIIESELVIRAIVPLHDSSLHRHFSFFALKSVISIRE